MFLAPFVYFIVFHYVPMAGLALAFADFRIGGFRGWIGLENFRFLFNLHFFWKAFRNTWVFVLLRYLIVFPAPIILALFLNEIRNKAYKKTIQTLTTVPHFLTWVIIAGIWMSLLSPSHGYVNDIIAALGGEPIFFFSKAKLFPWIFTGIRVWKETGYAAIIYFASLATIDPELYESAVIDGANRRQQTFRITIPGISQMILVVFVLSFTNVLNLFEPIFVLKNPMIDSTAEVLDTYVYTIGIVNARYSLATAMGLFKSTISLVLLIAANILSKRFTESGEGII